MDTSLSDPARSSSGGGNGSGGSSKDDNDKKKSISAALASLQKRTEFPKELSRLDNLVTTSYANTEGVISRGFVLRSSVANKCWKLQAVRNEDGAVFERSFSDLDDLDRLLEVNGGVRWDAFADNFRERFLSGNTGFSNSHSNEFVKVDIDRFHPSHVILELYRKKIGANELFVELLFEMADHVRHTGGVLGNEDLIKGIEELKDRNLLLQRQIKEYEKRLHDVHSGKVAIANPSHGVKASSSSSSSSATRGGTSKTIPTKRNLDPKALLEGRFVTAKKMTLERDADG